MKGVADSGGMYGQKNCRHACRSFSRLHGPGGFDSGRKSTHLHHCRRSSRFRPSNRIDHCCNFIPACRLRLRERAAEEMRSGYLCLNVVYAQVSALQKSVGGHDTYSRIKKINLYILFLFFYSYIYITIQRFNYYINMLLKIYLNIKLRYRQNSISNERVELLPETFHSVLVGLDWFAISSDRESMYVCFMCNRLH